MGGERRPAGRFPRLAGINLPEGLAAACRARASKEGVGAVVGAAAAEGAEDAATVKGWSAVCEYATVEACEALRAGAAHAPVPGSVFTLAAPGRAGAGARWAAWRAAWRCRPSASNHARCPASPGATAWTCDSKSKRAALSS